MAANNEYVNRVDLGNETIIDLTNDTATESDVLAGQTFHLRSGAPGTGTLNAVTEIQPGDNLGQIKASQLVGNDYNVDLPGFGTAYGLDIYDDTLPIQFTHPGGAIADGIVYGNNSVGKNKLEITAETQTMNGVTFTVDKVAGTITLNGDTSQQAGGFSFIIAQRTDLDGTYLLSGCADGGSSTSYDLYMYDEFDQRFSNRCYDSDDVVTFNCVAGHSTKIYIQCRKNYNYDNVVFRPMLRLPDTSSDFEPYQIGVGERTKNFIDLSVVSTETRTGVTFTVDRSAGTITVDGTNTGDADINYRIEGFTPPLPGNYYFSGCQEGGTLETYYIIPYDVDASALLRKWNGTSSTGNDYGTGPHEIRIEDTTILRFTIRIKAGYTADNLVFKPMLWLGSLGEDLPFIPYGYQIPLDLRQGMQYYDHKDLYIGLSPLTAGHAPIHFYEADMDLIAEPGTSYLDTTLYNKPRMELVPYSGIYNVIKRIREDEINKQNVSKVIWMGDAYKTLDGTLFPDYIELDVDDVDDYQIIEFDFRAITNSGKTYSWAKISLLNSDIKRWNSEFYSEDIFTNTNLQSATLCGLDGSGNVVYKNIAFQLQIDDYEKTIYYKFMYETDSVFGDYTITLRRIWGKPHEP